MEQILYWCAALVCIAGAVAIVIKVIKFVNDYHDRLQKYDGYDEQITKAHNYAQEELTKIKKEMTDKIEESQAETDAKIQQIIAEQYILTESMLAVLEGLKQLNCNGPVTTAKDKLEKHLNQQAHEGM